MNAAANLVPYPGSTARILTCSEEEYFKDPCEVPSLSQSIAHTMLAESPLHAWAKHPRLGNLQEREPTKALDAGSLMHTLLLGTGKEIVIVDAADWRTNAAKDARDRARVNGKVPILAHDYERGELCARIVRERIAAAGINLDELDAATPEIGIEWREGGRMGPVVCRGRLDKLLLLESRAVIFDFKKIRDAHPRTCGKHMIEYGYDIQHAAYTSAVQALRPDLAGRIDFLFLFLEDSQPFAVTPARPDGVMREHGEMRWQRAVELWERCLGRGVWPGYVETPISLEAPPWAISQEMNHVQ